MIAISLEDNALEARDPSGFIGTKLELLGTPRIAPARAMVEEILGYDSARDRFDVRVQQEGRADIRTTRPAKRYMQQIVTRVTQAVTESQIA